MAAKEAVAYLATEVAKDLVKDAASDIAVRLRRLVRRETPGEGLGPPQLTEIRARVEAVALGARLPKAKAEALADEFVKRLREP